jgi:glycosyltransferase involved in cell wall biosynthesis
LAQPRDPHSRAETNLLDDELSGLRRRHDELLAEAIQLEASIAAVRSSHTWRLLQVVDRLRRRARRVRARFVWLAGSVARRGFHRVPHNVRRAPLGVNVAGYLAAESGMGEAARASVRSLSAAGIPAALNHVASFLREQDRSHEAFDKENPHPFNLVHLNCDNMAAFRAARGRAYFRNRYTIGYWFWELSRFRDEWLTTFQYVDEVWVASEFGRQALLPHAPVPVIRMPLSVVSGPARPFDRAAIGIRPDTFVFLFMFDVSSQFERKNPIAVIQAFRDAGFRSGEAALILKYTNPEYDYAAVRRLAAESRGLSVTLLDSYMHREELTGLIAAADCYVSLHRSEGFGLTLAEAMAAGKPVVATGYSGNCDFMTEDNSYLVDYRIEHLTRDHGPYPAGFEWAEPDIAQAATIMRRVLEDQDGARRIGARAAADMATLRNPRVTGEAMRARLDAIRAGRLDARG